MSKSKRTVQQMDSADIEKQGHESHGVKHADSSQVDYEMLELTVEEHAHVLLTEYQETIETLRNWDKIVYNMLTVIGTASAALIAFSAQGQEPFPWGAIISLILFWLFFYIWQVKLAEPRIATIRQIEDTLGMAGQYRRTEVVKSRRTFTLYVVLPYLGAFVIGPLLGLLIRHGETILELLRLWLASL
ncbi:MAG: hypothetical protein R3300_22085 [Candidatus Promineifilaceae bacterium]|nr:hypothetical protein [Candidatus Promineifilaceae bacterium]